MVRKIANAAKKGSGAAMMGVMGVMDKLLIDRLMKQGVIDEEERKMMKKHEKHHEVQPIL